MPSISKALQAVYKHLSDRQKEVIIGRFGLGKNNKRETLEALGRKFGVTRERVRQIEAAALIILKNEMAKEQAFSSVSAESKKYLKSAGGVLKKEILLDLLSKDFPDITENQLALVIATLKEFYFYDGDKDYHDFYYLDKNAFKNASGFINQWVSSLKGQKEKVLLTGAYDEKLKAFLKSKNVSPIQAENYISISKKIHRNPFGDIGLAEWAEVKPKTIRDRIYLVLKKQGKPVHFQAIAELINQASFDKRKALASTVHNELIKDERFVLVGRGMYGLSEHGYEKGTAREVIQRILKKNGPLKSKDIVAALEKERFFKYNTILVNLQNRNFFERRSDGTYDVREA